MRTEFRRLACLAVMALALTSTTALAEPSNDVGGHEGLAPLAMLPLLQPTPIGTDRILLEATLIQPAHFGQASPLFSQTTLPEVQLQSGPKRLPDIQSGGDRMATLLRGTDRI